MNNTKGLIEELEKEVSRLKEERRTNLIGPFDDIAQANEINGFSAALSIVKNWHINNQPEQTVAYFLKSDDGAELGPYTKQQAIQGRAHKARVSNLHYNIIKRTTTTEPIA